MTDKDTARPQIAALVEKFRDTPQSQRNSFSEQETREFFILPLFRALGWDTENPAEFSAEEQISRGFVDFGFYLSYVPAFYLETKRAAEKLEKPEFMKQAINYAFLKGVTWAVLTDFEQLMVFNAEWEETDPTRARFLDLKWEQYSTDHFDDLWLLSKASFQEREIDRVAERFGKKSRKQPVTDVLFKQLTVWRRELFEQMRTYGRTLWSTDPRAVDNAVQKFLDRMIFIRTVEDRGVEPNQLRSLVRQANNKTLYSNLLKLFRDLDAVYNSNLFAESETDRMEVHDPDLIRDIVEGLYGDRQGFVNYDFNAITADVLGAVYEQYLGFKAQDPTGEQALDPRKQEKRKKQGIYYTPQFVVRYIVRQTLGKLLETGVDAHNLRILDPACGSGSFLIEAFDVLDRWLALNGDETDRSFPRRRRLRILQENLYGVDLDEQAVEVTRLNLMLRAAIERDKLPLLTHIQHGNSLIDDPDVAGAAAFKWEERFPEVMGRGGFDVVIGNPPYGAKLSDEQLEFIHTVYANKSKSFDTFEVFLAKSADLISETGQVGMIIPSSWLTGDKYILSRQSLLNALSPKVAYALPFDVFVGAYIDTAVVVFAHVGESNEAETCLIHTFPKKEKLSEIPIGVGVAVPAQRIRQDDGHRFSITFSDELISIYNKLQKCEMTFGDSFVIQRGVQPYGRQKQTEEQIQQRFLHAKSRINDTYLPELQGDELARYWVAPERKSYLEYSERLASSRPPRMFQGKRIVLRRLLTRQFRLQAGFTSETMITTDNVLNLVPQMDNVSVLYALGILNSKIISWFYISRSMVAQKDDFPQVHISALSQLPIPTADKARHDRMVSLVETMLRLKQEHAAAEAALSDDRHRLAEQIEHTDRQIDGLVYELYGLTAEEITLVEG